MDKENKVPKTTAKTLVASSSGSGNLSTTLKGLLVLMIPVLITIGRRYNIEVTETQVMEIVQRATEIIGQILLVYGLIRKFWIWLRESFGVKKTDLE